MKGYKRESVLVLCSPADAYKGMNEAEAARAYRRMAFHDWDKFLGFTREYAPWQSIPDFKQIIGTKQKRDLELTAFLEQQCIKIGKMERPFVSSSYLINVLSINGKVKSPDLDVVEFSQGIGPVYSAKEAAEFYRSFGWQTHIFEGEVPLVFVDGNETSRFGCAQTEIINYSFLRELAQRTIGYDPTKFCWKEKRK